MTSRRPGFWICLLLVLPWGVGAESAYVIDRVEVGLYENASFDSPILKLLPTGTELEILGRENDLVQVRDPDGMTGWIDPRYLMEAKPTRQLLNEAEAEMAQLRAELDSVRRQAATPAPPGVDADTDKLVQIRDRLQAELAAERQRITELKGQVASLQREAAAEAAPETGPVGAQGFMESLQRVRGNHQLLIILGVAFLIGLMLGIYLLDHYNRRRHGGFRV